MCQVILARSPVRERAGSTFAWRGHPSGLAWRLLSEILMQTASLNLMRSAHQELVPHYPRHDATMSDTEPPIVVLVDDNPGDIGLMTMAFDAQNLDVDLRTIGSGPDAFYFFRDLAGRAQPEVPRLLLLDLNMPGLNGFQLLTYLRSQQVLEPMKIVIFSSTHRSRDHARAMELGANGILVKPPDWPSYAAVIDQIRLYLGGVGDGAPSVLRT